jgi:hypothetical protein
MNMPKFTAEASLYGTRDRNQTPRRSINFSGPTDIAIHPALPEEVINVKGCMPGYTLWEAGGEWGCALDEPPSGGVPSDDGPSGGPGSGGGGDGPPPPPSPGPGHVCSTDELNRVTNYDSQYTQKFQECKSSGGYLRCIPIVLPGYGNYGNHVYCCKYRYPKKDSCTLIFSPPTPPRVSTSVQVV